MGSGYASMVASLGSALYPEHALRFVNRGISGNRVADLKQRWDTDCIRIKPAVLSIMIGINETWRRFDSGDPTPVDSFYRDYHDMLTAARKACNPAMVLCEPFVLPVPEDRRKWREDLDPKIAAVRQLAHEFGAILVPFDGMLAAASTRVEPAYWAADGVHPTAAGHAFLAKAWMECVLGVRIG
jgi:lysophospholipase L1-like esterase